MKSDKRLETPIFDGLIAEIESLHDWATVKSESKGGGDYGQDKYAALLELLRGF